MASVVYSARESSSLEDPAIRQGELASVDGFTVIGDIEGDICAGEVVEGELDTGGLIVEIGHRMTSLPCMGVASVRAKAHHQAPKGPAVRCREDVVVWCLPGHNWARLANGVTGMSAREVKW